LRRRLRVESGNEPICVAVFADAEVEETSPGPVAGASEQDDEQEGAVYAWSVEDVGQDQKGGEVDW